MKEIFIDYISDIHITKFLIAVFLFYILDFITGFSKAWRDKNIKSSKLRNSVTKAIQYFAFISIGIITDIIFEIDKGGITCCFVLCGVELKSIIENFEDLKLPEFIINLFKGGENSE